jgi:hypothetical protein
MTGLIEEIQRWRMCADELRAAADGMINEAARDAILDMAEGYDRLANRLAIFHAKQGHGSEANGVSGSGRSP